MGNTLQCTPHYSTTSSYTIKVVHYSNPNTPGCGGGVVEHLYASPTTRVADLLLDHPGHFVCDAARLTVGHRVPALPPDEPLAPRRLYFLLPTDLLYSVLTHEEAAALSSISTKRAKKKKHHHQCRSGGGSGIGVRIFPTATATAATTQGEERIMWRQQPWRPALDTIEEIA
ncbi:uncharacterized protein LOC109716709 [Ananas comosus]|uniref:Uncharacterized protein LOC109716709 n=1 Tax=Ananas comosus TaxID=4615 RepID=A0A6P5FXX2_ANACO|nr:uncharacterized protein LOC109716709 [Ananas comosus]